MAKSIAVITGSGGLVGSEASAHFRSLGMTVIGIDNDSRSYFFGEEASVLWNVDRLQQALGDGYRHVATDIRNEEQMNSLFQEHGENIDLVVHAAAQPSHDWAAREPNTDFSINAVGTLNLLEATRRSCPEAVFIFVSTNKVYGDTVNRLPMIEKDSRWELDPAHPWSNGIPEEMSVDSTLHSLFGASKLSADVLVQEYGRYFGMKTACFRAGCITGPSHSGAQLHGFLAYIVKCAMMKVPYTVFGYKGKQVRDNIHSADLISAFEAFYQSPRSGAVYNIGGGRASNCSMLEAIEMSEEVVGNRLDWSYEETNRIGDHIWWISDLSKFRSDYESWNITYDVPAIVREIYEQNLARWKPES